jgi:hypothetical protein
MRDAAIPVLTRWRVQELLEERNVRALEHATLLQELAHAKHESPWWERAVFGDVEDAARVRELTEATARAWEASAATQREAAAAVAGAANELLPIEIAARVEAIVADVLRDPRVGRLACERETEIIAELDALAVRVASVWLLDYSPERLAHVVQHLAQSESTRCPHSPGTSASAGRPSPLRSSPRVQVWSSRPSARFWLASACRRSMRTTRTWRGR